VRLEGRVCELKKRKFLCVFWNAVAPGGLKELSWGIREGRVREGNKGGTHFPFPLFPQMIRITPLPSKMKCSCRTPASGLNRHIIHMEPTHPSTTRRPPLRTHPNWGGSKNFVFIFKY